MVIGDSDWPTVLLQCLDESPLVLQNTFSKKELRTNSWQCHILACVFTCLAPRLRAEITDWRSCSSNGELAHSEVSNIVQVASKDAVHALRQAETFVQACDGEDACSLIISTACTGEALTVQVHNIFWCSSSLMLATRVALGFPDDRLTMLIEQQVHCWSHNISRYISLGAELLDLKDLAFMVEKSTSKDSEHTLFQNVDLETPLIARLLFSKLKWVLCRDRIKGNQVESLLANLKIDFNDLILEQRAKEEKYARAIWGGIWVTLRRCSLDVLRQHVVMLLRMRNPFVLQLIGWSDATTTVSVAGMENKQSSCYMVMEYVQTDLESFIKKAMESKSTDEEASPFSFSNSVDMMLQVARGMWYLHRNGIAHKGLRSNSILLHIEPANGAVRLKLSDIGPPSFAVTPSRSDYAADVHAFGLLSKEILTGKLPAVVSNYTDLRLPASTPVLLSDCLKACNDLNPKSRPEFGVICGLLRHLKLIVSNPRHLECLLYLNEASKVPASKPPAVGDHASPVIKGTGKATPDDMHIRIQLIDINSHLLYSNTPPEIYPLVASDSWSAKQSIPLKVLEDMPAQLMQRFQTLGVQDETSTSSTSSNVKFVVSNASTLVTSLVSGGFQGLLKSGWANTSLGLGTLETWLHHMSFEWKAVQKVAVGVALCLRHVSQTPPKIGFYSHGQGTIDGFYPICPCNILLNHQLKVALLLDNTLPAWQAQIQWAGLHPQVGEGADNILLSTEAYTTFYFGHLLSSILEARQCKVHLPCSDHHSEFVLTNLAMRCIQLKYLSMTEVVTILLNDSKPLPKPVPLE